MMRANYFTHTVESLGDAIMAANGGIDFAADVPVNQTIAHVTHEDDVNGLSIWRCYGTGTYHFTHDKDSLKKLSRAELEKMALDAISADEYYCLLDALSDISSEDLISIVFGDLDVDGNQFF